MSRSLCRISLNGLCGRRTGTTEHRRRVEEDREEDDGGKSLDTPMQGKYVELRQHEGMSSSPLESFQAPPPPPPPKKKRQHRERVNNTYPSI